MGLFTPPPPPQKKKKKQIGRDCEGPKNIIFVPTHVSQR